MEVTKPQSFSPVPPLTVPSAPTAGSAAPVQSGMQGTVRPAAPSHLPLKKPLSRTSFFVILGLVISVLILVIGYVVFIKPDTSPAAVLFGKLFPVRSGLIQLQEVELDFDAVVNNGVFQKLKHWGNPIQVPPLGKPNPFL